MEVIREANLSHQKNKKKQNNKSYSIFHLFIIHLTAFLLAIMLVFVGAILSAYILMQKGILLPSNATEQRLMTLENRLASDFDRDLLPADVLYLVLDSGGKSLETNMPHQEISKVKNYLTSGDKPYSTYYKFINQDHGQVLVIQYKVMVRFSNPILARLIPYPEIEVIVLLLVLMVLLGLWTAVKFSRKLKVNLKPIVLATDKIRNQDLDFEIEATDILEFNQSLKAIDQLKSALRDSLEQQWTAQQQQKLQLSALAHDINTPLTVIKGNADLLIEVEDNADKKSGLNDIRLSTQTIEKYMQLLMNALNDNRLVADIQVNKLNYFLHELTCEILPLCKMKEIGFVICNNSDVDELRMDSILIKRAIVNLVNNAIAYSHQKAEIVLTIIERETTVSFEIKDEGKGFSHTSLMRATEAFYTEDISRGEHQGLGLNFVERVCKLHGGELVIENRADSRGAIVSICLPK